MLSRGRYLERRGVVHFVKGSNLEQEDAVIKGPEEKSAKDGEGHRDTEASLKDRSRVPEGILQDKHLRKEERRRRKEDRKRRKQERSAREDKSSTMQQESPERSAGHSKHAKVHAVAEHSLPSLVPAHDHQNAPSNRPSVRSRYIRQKKLAMTDTKALNEVSSLGYHLSWLWIEGRADPSPDFDDQSITTLTFAPSAKAKNR